VKLPCCPSPAALPVLFRLWRGKGTASQPELAARLLKVLAWAFPGRAVHGTGDCAFHGESLVIEGTTWTTRLPSNAVLSGPKPPPTGNRGRPREKGDRIGTCADAAKTAGWQDTVIRAYGKTGHVQASSQRDREAAHRRRRRLQPHGESRRVHPSRSRSSPSP
jgi:hypothetical protein